jgi:hypothetical protein
MGLAAELTGNYQRGLLTLVVPSLASMFIMFGIRHDALRRKRTAVTILT